MSDDETTLPLSDVTLERARMENETIDKQFSDLEERVATLEDEKAELEDEKETLEDEKAAYKQVVTQYREQRREELLGGLRERIEAAAVDADSLDVDFEALEEADLDTIKATKETVEAALDAAGIGSDGRVSNRDSTPDLGGVDGGGTDYEEAFAEAAADLGMGSAWEKVQAGEPLAGGPPVSGQGQSSGREETLQELADIVNEVSRQ